MNEKYINKRKNPVQNAVNINKLIKQRRHNCTRKKRTSLKKKSKIILKNLGYKLK